MPVASLPLLLKFIGEPIFKNPVGARRCFHTSVTLSILFCLSYVGYLTLQFFDEIDKNDYLSHGYKYSPYFFSLWCTGMQIVYFYMYTLIDILEVYFKHNPKLVKMAGHIHDAASYLLFTIVFPMSFSVLILFWISFAYNRDIIYPELLDQYLPPWINHAIHTLPVPLSVVYMFTSNRNEPPKHSCFSGLLAFLGVYAYLFLSIRFKEGKWVYPGMELLTPLEVSCILAGGIIGPVFFFPLGYKVNSFMKSLRTQFPLIFV